VLGEELLNERTDSKVFRMDEAWMGVTHALGGLFCAGLGGEIDESVNTFGGIYPPVLSSTNSMSLQ
jgi:hypothetical protein